MDGRLCSRRNSVGGGRLWRSAWRRKRSGGHRADVMRSHHRRQAEYRDGQHDRGLLRPRRRLRRGDQSADRRHAESHRRRDVGVAAEHPAARGGHPSGGVLPCRHRGRRGQRDGGVRREPAHRRADPALSQLHPGDRPQRRRHQLDPRYARQAGVHRVAELRHRGHRQPHAGGRRSRPEHGRCRRSAPNSARRSKG